MVNPAHWSFYLAFSLFRLATICAGVYRRGVGGNAHAMLAAYLWDLGQLGKKTLKFLGRQGRQMNRPGEVRVRLELDQGKLLAAHIGGTAVIISEGTLAM